MTFIRKVETWITNSKQTEDGWSQIKPFIFLKLTNSDGFEGWGEAFSLPAREKGIVEIIHNLMSSLSHVKDITPDRFYTESNLIADGHRGIDFSAATSAIEMSLWDIEGKKKKNLFIKYYQRIIEKKFLFMQQYGVRILKMMKIYHQDV